MRLRSLIIVWKNLVMPTSGGKVSGNFAVGFETILIITLLVINLDLIYDLRYVNVTKLSFS